MNGVNSRRINTTNFDVVVGSKSNDELIEQYKERVREWSHPPLTLSDINGKKVATSSIHLNGHGANIFYHIMVAISSYAIIKLLND